MQSKIILQTNSEIISTLLIPVSMIHLLNKKEKDFGSLKKYLHHLVGSINPLFYHYNLEPGKSTLSFQPRNEFVRRNFRPFAEDWEILRMHAFSLRVSMAFLFVLLLLYDEAFREVPGGVPTSLKNFTLIQHINITPTFTYIELNKFLL